MQPVLCTTVGQVSSAERQQQCEKAVITWHSGPAQ